jgi:hypothetical protein
MSLLALVISVSANAKTVSKVNSSTHHIKVRPYYYAGVTDCGEPYAISSATPLDPLDLWDFMNNQLCD